MSAVGGSRRQSRWTTMPLIRPAYTSFAEYKGRVRTGCPSRHKTFTCPPSATEIAVICTPFFIGPVQLWLEIVSAISKFGPLALRTSSFSPEQFHTRWLMRSQAESEGPSSIRVRTRITRLCHHSPTFATGRKRNVRLLGKAVIQPLLSQKPDS